MKYQKDFKNFIFNYLIFIFLFLWKIRFFMNIWFILKIWFYIIRYWSDLPKFKKFKIGLTKTKALLFILILFIGFSSTSPKTRIILANSLESSAWFLYETVDKKNKDKWYVENRFISFIKIKFNKLFKGYHQSY